MLIRNLLFFSLSLSFLSCASMGPVRSENSVLKRGWSFLEPKSVREARPTDADPINFSAPLAVEDRILFGTVDFGLYGLDSKSGRLVFQKRVVGGVVGDPMIEGEAIYVGSGDGHFYAFNRVTGSKNWSRKFDMPVVGKPVFWQDRIFVATIDGVVYALDSFTGKNIWTYRRRQQQVTTIKGGGNFALIDQHLWTGFSDGALVVLNLQDGSIVMEKQFRDNPKFTDIDAQPIAYRKGVLVTSYDGKLRFLTKSGVSIWEYPEGGARAPLVSDIQGGICFLASSDGRIVALDCNRGKKIWHYDLPKGIGTSMDVIKSSNSETKGTLVVSTSDEYVVAFDALTGELLDRVSLGSGSGSYSKMLVADRNVYVLSRMGRLYQFTVNR